MTTGCVVSFLNITSVLLKCWATASFIMQEVLYWDQFSKKASGSSLQYTAMSRIFFFRQTWQKITSVHCQSLSKNACPISKLYIHIYLIIIDKLLYEGKAFGQKNNHNPDNTFWNNTASLKYLNKKIHTHKTEEEAQKLLD